MTREDGQMLGTSEIVVPEVSQQDRKQAVRTVASKAVDAADLTMLLDICGLNPKEAL